MSLSIATILEAVAMPGIWPGRYFRHTHFILGKEVSNIVINCENELVYYTVVGKLAISFPDFKKITNNEFKIGEYNVLVNCKRRHMIVNFDLVDYNKRFFIEEDFELFKKKSCKFLVDHTTLTREEIEYMSHYHYNGWSFESVSGEKLVFSEGKFVSAKSLPLTIGNYNFVLNVQKELTPELAQTVKETVGLMLA